MKPSNPEYFESGDDANESQHQEIQCRPGLHPDQGLFQEPDMHWKLHWVQSIVDSEDHAENVGADSQLMATRFFTCS